jgi:hypothetical protein
VSQDSSPDLTDPRPHGAHLAQDRLHAVAAGGTTLTDTETAHVAGCDRCAAEVARRSADQMLDGDMLPPSVIDEAGLPEQAPAPPQSAPPAVPDPKTAPPERHHRFGHLAMMAAAAIVGVAFGAGVTAGVKSAAPAPHQPTTTGLASASLSPSATSAAGGSGSAQLLLIGGRQVLRVRIAAMPRPDGFYQVWLADPAGRMVALGTIGSSDSVDLPVPAAVDPHVFGTVDVAAQSVDADPRHGISLLRGQLH